LKSLSYNADGPNQTATSTVQRLKARPSTPLGTRSPPAIDQLHATKYTGSSSPQEAIARAQPPHQHENQLLQMLADMKELMKE